MKTQEYISIHRFRDSVSVSLLEDSSSPTFYLSPGMAKMLAIQLIVYAEDALHVKYVDSKKKGELLFDPLSKEKPNES